MGPGSAPPWRSLRLGTSRSSSASMPSAATIARWRAAPPPARTMRSTASGAASEPISPAWPRTDSTVARTTSEERRAACRRPGSSHQFRRGSHGSPIRAPPRRADDRAAAASQAPCGQRMHQRRPARRASSSGTGGPCPESRWSRGAAARARPPDQGVVLQVAAAPRVAASCRRTPPSRRTTRGTPRAETRARREARARRTRVQPEPVRRVRRQPYQQGKAARAGRSSTRTGRLRIGHGRRARAARSPGVRRIRPRIVAATLAIAVRVDERAHHRGVRVKVQTDRHQRRPTRPRPGHRPRPAAAPRAASPAVRPIEVRSSISEGERLVVGQRLGQVDLGQHPLGHVREGDRPRRPAAAPPRYRGVSGLELPKACGTARNLPAERGLGGDPAEHERRGKPAGVSAGGDAPHVAPAANTPGAARARASIAQAAERGGDAGHHLDRGQAGAALDRRPAVSRAPRSSRPPCASRRAARSSSATRTRRARPAGGRSTARRRSRTRCWLYCSPWRCARWHGARTAARAARSPRSRDARGGRGHVAPVELAPCRRSSAPAASPRRRPSPVAPRRGAQHQLVRLAG